MLTDKLGIKNRMALPRVEKVVVNIGLGEATENPAVIEKAAQVLKQITGQQPKTTRARISISAFKLRRGMPIGVMVTLRGKMMYHFLEKLVRIVLPRLRDFRGVALKNFDAQGNYTLGLNEQIIFPEVDYEKIDKVRGLEITIVTSTASAKEAKLLLEGLGVPFEKNSEPEKKLKEKGK